MVTNWIIGYVVIFLAKLFWMMLHDSRHHPYLSSLIINQPPAWQNKALKHKPRRTNKAWDLSMPVARKLGYTSPFQRKTYIISGTRQPWLRSMRQLSSIKDMHTRYFLCYNWTSLEFLISRIVESVWVEKIIPLNYESDLL